eukprot:7994322-Ditylum_brightwellii.AAC.1
MSAFSVPKKSNQQTENPQVQTKITAASQDPTLEVADLPSKENPLVKSQTTVASKAPFPEVVGLPSKGK